MKSAYGVDYEAGYLPEVPKELKKAFKKSGIKLSKKAYVIFPYDEKGEPAYTIVVDGDKAYITIDNVTYELTRAQDFESDDLIYIGTNDFVDIVALESDAEYFKLSPEDAPHIVAIGIIHEELGLRHAIIPLSDMYELRGEAKDEFLGSIKEELEKHGVGMMFEPSEFKVAFVSIPEEELEKLVAPEDEEELEEASEDEYEAYAPSDDLEEKADEE